MAHIADNIKTLVRPRADDSADLLSETTAVKTVSLEEKDAKQAEEEIQEQPEKTAKSGTEAAETKETVGNSLFSKTADGSYILINHSGDDSISAEGDITVMAAGLNRISSISGTGTVSIAGSGILLVDSIDGNVQLLTLTDIYQSGSVALFVKESEGRYVLRNGTVPGILDEDYLIEGITLVMPNQTSLLLKY